MFCCDKKNGPNEKLLSWQVYDFVVATTHSRCANENLTWSKENRRQGNCALVITIIFFCLSMTDNEIKTPLSSIKLNNNFLGMKLIERHCSNIKIQMENGNRNQFNLHVMEDSHTSFFSMYYPLKHWGGCRYLKCLCLMPSFRREMSHEDKLNIKTEMWCEIAREFKLRSLLKWSTTENLRESSFLKCLRHFL